MNRYTVISMTLLIFFMSCNSNSTSSEVSDFDRLYVALQGTDKVAILNASTLEVIDEVDIGSMDEMSMGTTPHYIALDEVNGYWFVSEIMANTIAMYSMETNELIDILSVDEDASTEKEEHATRDWAENHCGKPETCCAGRRFFPLAASDSWNPLRCLRGKSGSCPRRASQL